MQKVTQMIDGKAYQIILKDKKHLVGYATKTSYIVFSIRTGLNTAYIGLVSEIKEIIELSPRDIETRKNGKYFIY